MRALCVYLPDWPIWLARRQKNSSGGTRFDKTAWLLWTRQREIQLIACCCDSAANKGVRPGMTLAHARSLLSGMTIEEQLHEPENVLHSLNRFARWMLRFAPTVSVDEADGITLDIEGCSHLFKGEQRHVRAICEALQPWGFHFRIAVAPSGACAWAVARHAPQQITLVDNAASVMGSLPIAGLNVDVPLIEALEEVGITRIHQLLAIPRDEIAARFGAALLQRLDAMSAAAHESLQSVQCFHPLQACREFEAPIARLESVEATLRELLRELLVQLEEVQCGVLVLEAYFRRIDLESIRFPLSLSYPSRDFEHLWTLLAPRLERVHLGFGVEEIALTATRTSRLENKQASFLTEPGNPSQLGELVDCLIDRLGAHAVTQPAPTENYLPETAFTHPSARCIFSDTKKKPDMRLYPAHRPSVVFERPSPVRVISLVPDGPPRWIEWKERSGEVIASEGPERLMSRWWDSTREQRDYYEVEDQHGRRLWVFRESFSNRWFVHGQWV